MAATVNIVRLTGAGPTATTITSINTRANAEDAHSTAGTTNPIQIPAAGANYSYWVTTRLIIDAAPTGTINNIKWYTDGTNGFGTGVTCVGNSAAAYVQATGTPGTSGTELNQANHAQLSASVTNVFTFTAVGALSISGSTSAGTGQIGNMVVYQIQVANTASPGATGAETFTWKFDET